MRLDAYLNARGITPAAFARKLKVSRQSVHGYLDGSEPLMKMARKIEKVTDGEVTLYDWPIKKEEVKLDEI